MKRIRLSAIAPLCLAALVAVGGTAKAQPVSDFGSPPSGQIPILYNDHTVYAAPDLLKQGRVLAALVKDGQIYVPLRSMFEAMGATVSVSTDGNTYTVTRGDTSASVTLGKNEVVVDGSTRPLDVPPMMYQGVVVVPVRVLSEALGAYVLVGAFEASRCGALYSADAAAGTDADAGANGRTDGSPHPRADAGTLHRLHRGGVLGA